MALVDFHMEGCASHLHHVYQRDYVAMHETNPDGAERNICCDCVDGLRMGGKTQKLNKVEHSNVYKTDKLE